MINLKNTIFFSVKTAIQSNVLIVNINTYKYVKLKGFSPL